MSTKYIKLPITEKQKDQTLTCVNKNGNIAVGLIHQSRLDYSFTCITEINGNKSYLYDVTDYLFEFPSREDEMRELLEDLLTHHFDFMGCGEIKELQSKAEKLLNELKQTT